MLLTKTERDTLLKPLQIVSGIVERRHTLPILSNVLLEKQDDQLNFIATDLEIQISTKTPCNEGTNHAITVSARKLQDILRALPETATLHLETADNKLQIKTGKSLFNLQTLPVEDFPRLAVSVSTSGKIRVAQGAFKNLLLLVQYAMAQQDIRYYLNGLLLLIEGKKLKAVATDGHRLSYASLDLSQESEKREVIIPRKTVLELSKLLSDSADEVIIELDEKQAHFSFSDIVLISKLVDGKFPDYTRVVPSGYHRQFEISRMMLLQAMQRAAILSSEKFRGVRLLLTTNSLKIICTNNEQEEAQEELEVTYSKEALDIGFNVNYLLDVLNNLDEEKVICAFGDANSSALITIPGNEHFKYVVMPMRI